MNKIKNNSGDTTNFSYDYNAGWLSSEQENDALFPPEKEQSSKPNSIFPRKQVRGVSWR